MPYINIDWSAVAREMQKGGPLESIHLGSIKDFKRITPVESIFLLRNLLRDFGVRDDCIIAECEEAERKDTVEWALYDHLKHRCGDLVNSFDEIVPSTFNQILKDCRGFTTDWKYDDSEVEWWLNKDHLLPKYGLQISFSPHEDWYDPFEISLLDKNTCTTVEKATFRFSNGEYAESLRKNPELRPKKTITNWHDMHELINAINGLLEKKGLVLLDADEGGDSYVFVLFEIGEIDRLKEKYEDPAELINFDKVVHILRAMPDAPVATEKAHEKKRNFFDGIMGRLKRT